MVTYLLASYDGARFETLIPGVHEWIYGVISPLPGVSGLPHSTIPGIRWLVTGCGCDYEVPRYFKLVG